jgi:hypothetical protein
MKTYLALILQLILSINLFAIEFKTIQGPKYSDGTFASLGQIFFDRKGDFIARGSYAIFKSSNRGQSWSSTSPFGITGDRIYDVALDTNNNMLAATDLGIFRYASGWEDLSDLLPNGAILTVSVTQTGTIYIVFKNTDIYFSKNNGKSWTLKTEGPTHENFNFSPSLYAGYDSTMYLIADSKIYSTHDGSTKWIQITGLPIPRNRNRDDSVMYRASSTGFYISRNKGKTFIKQSSQATSEIFMDKYGKIYAKDPVNGALVSSYDDGKTWKVEFKSSSTTLREMAIDTLNFLYNTVYTQGSNSNLSRSVLPLAVKQQQTASISSVYPNPASTSITIWISAAYQGEVSLALFDDRGIKVLSKHLFSDDMKIDVSHLPSGIYSCQLQLGELIETKRIMVTK